MKKLIILSLIIVLISDQVTYANYNLYKTTGTADSKLFLPCTNPPAKPGTITVSGGSVKVCPGDVRIYTIAAVFEATSYNWAVPTGATITNGQGTTSITISFNSGFTTFGTLSVTASNECGTSAPRNLTINRNNPAIPGTISGNIYSACPNTSGTYSVTNVSGITYNWTSPPGASIASGQGTNSVSVNFSGSFVSGALQVTATNACGTSNLRTATIYSIPSLPSAITGNIYGVCSNTSGTYSVTNIIGMSYNWTSPPGASIVSGQGTNSVNVNFSGSFVSGALQVTANNACGTSAIRKVTIYSIPSLPGTITGNIYNNCNATNIYSIRKVNGATSYIWNTNIPGAIINVNSSPGDTVATVTFSTFVSGTISVNASNACGESLFRNLTVKGTVAIPSAITGNTFVTPCFNETYSINLVSGASSYTWKLPTGSYIVSGQGTTNILVHFGNNNGTITVKGVNACGSSGASILTVKDTVLTPAGLNVSNISPVSAQLNWTQLPGTINYNIRYKPVSSSTWIILTSSSSTITINSLVPATNYEIQVQGVCSVFSGAYSISENFTTLSSQCNTPEELSVTSITSSSATLNWTAISDAVSYNVQYRPIGGTWINITSTTNSINISGLGAALTYEWKVQSVCQFSNSTLSAPRSFTTLQTTAPIDSLVTIGAVWKYSDTGTDLGTEWRGPSFNDSSWSSGPAELGYGDGDENTVVGYGPDPNNKYTTTYFRKTINIPNPSQYSAFNLGIVRDDGAVVYINGTEVYRTNMPSGTITYTTFSATGVGGTDETTWFNTSVGSSAFVPGNNIIAVEIHQNTIASSDISFKMRLTGTNSSANIALQRGPYLQVVTPNTIHIRWRSDVATNSRVRYGTDMSYGNIVDSSTVTTEHEIKLSGLIPSTKYYYTIGSSTRDLQGNPNNFFKTSIPAGNTSPFKVWVTGDFGNGSSTQDAVRDAYMNHVGENTADIWIWLGDNAYATGTDNEFTTRVFEKYPDQFKNHPVYPALGNHDYAQSGYQSAAALGTNFPYFNSFTCPSNGEAGGVASTTEKYYSYNYGNTHFIVLDSYGALNNVGSPMYNWLQSDLAANTQRWIVCYWHHPPFTMGTHNSDTGIESVNIRQAIVPLLESYKVDLVLCGHSHDYERSFLISGHYGTESTLTPTMKIDESSGNAPYYLKSSPNFTGTIYAVVGNSGQGGPVSVQGSWPHAIMYSYNNSLWGSMILDINNDSLHAKFLTSTGSVYDEFKMVKSGSARLAGSLILKAKSEEAELSVFPNPFTDETVIRFQLNEESPVTIEIFDMTGRKVYSIENSEMQSEGIHEVQLNSNNMKKSTGIFLVRVKTNSKVMSKFIERSK